MTSLLFLIVTIVCDSTIFSIVTILFDSVAGVSGCRASLLLEAQKCPFKPRFFGHSDFTLEASSSTFSVEHMWNIDG